MTRPNKNPVHVTDEFERKTIQMIKRIIMLNHVMRHDYDEQNKSIAFDILNTDISVDFYNALNGKPDCCDLYIGSDAIRYTGKQALALYDSFQIRWSVQASRQTAAKEEELIAKLRNYMNSGNTK